MKISSQSLTSVHTFKVNNRRFVVFPQTGFWSSLSDLEYKILSSQSSNLISCLEHPESSLGEHSTLAISKSISKLKQLSDFSRSIERCIPEGELSTTASEVYSLVVNLTNNCNLSCSYCFSMWPNHKDNYGLLKDSMSKVTARRTIDFLFDNSESDEPVGIAFFGGEPTLEFDILKYMVNYGKNRALKLGRVITYGLTTNGYLFPPDFAEFIRDNNIGVILTIDGNELCHNFHRLSRDGNETYNKICLNALELTKILGQVAIRGSYTSKTLKYFFESVISLWENGFENVSIEEAIAPSKSSLSFKLSDLETYEEQYSELTKEYLNRITFGNGKYLHHIDHFLGIVNNIDLSIKACGAGGGYLGVAPNGDIYPCHMFVGNNKYLIGNVGGNLNNSVRDKVFSINRTNITKCKSCWARCFCTGHCMAISECILGKVDTPWDIMCEFNKIRIKYAIWLYDSLESECPSNILDRFSNGRALWNVLLTSDMIKRIDCLMKDIDNNIVNIFQSELREGVRLIDIARQISTKYKKNIYSVINVLCSLYTEVSRCFSDEK